MLFRSVKDQNVNGKDVPFSALSEIVEHHAAVSAVAAYRTNKKPRENLKILGLLYGISAFSGVIIEIFTKLMA